VHMHFSPFFCWDTDKGGTSNVTISTENIHKNISLYVNTLLACKPVYKIEMLQMGDVTKQRGI